MALYGIKDCANLTLFDKATGEPAIFSDYANVSTNEWKSSRVYANSKGTRSIAWDHNREGTLTVEMEVFDLKWLALLAGSEIKEGEANIAKREVVHIGATKKATLTGTPVAGSVQIVKVGADEIEHIGAPLTEVPSAPTAKQFSITGGEVTFATDAVAGETYAIYYLVLDTKVKSFDISSDKFPKAFEVVADALIREKETATDEFVQIKFPIARPQSNFTVTMDTANPTKLNVTFDLFPDKNNVMATYNVIGE
ncbi:hypothetical protein [Bacillus paranthracis]|uniref:hypothetical protein n=1 Tax=Bacillus paranthracis TaxID=2026186 RepID=UPI002D77F72B|nr:hypothetical protein [Bacillus paranthracis]